LFPLHQLVSSMARFGILALIIVLAWTIIHPILESRKKVA
jgi:hypothetical protein